MLIHTILLKYYFQRIASGRFLLILLLVSEDKIHIQERDNDE
ncbi:hypothetical protein [Bacillus sp. ISL-75]|nr:hypothetical protein [Bacillus sp. ISL-75]